MFTADFDYHLPQNLIAQTPLSERDQSRMMVVERQSGKIFHSRFKELPQHLSQGNVLVLNDTKVIPAKAWGLRGENEIEFLFLKEKEKGIWEVLCKPARKVKLGEKISFAPDFVGRITGLEPEGKRLIQFSSSNVLSELKKVGFPPLPPYIKRSKENSSLKLLDSERYQTVFAQKQGAIAAPTAGLHFTRRILEKIKKRGVHINRITLDVGRATFQPVRAERIEDHKMLAENYSISAASARTINKAKIDSRPVMAVGSTVVRALESASQEGEIQAGRHSTSLFIIPGYKFKTVDRLLTNFHLPKSTLLMMVAAFSSLELIKRAYGEAIRQKYRFYSYGDCMLIL
ncbi:MAG: tRNA preQ1(34) S-adenosylmethionine ribosyltransferase-isomerase QueA [Candidatus Aminicenantes bacterium]|nr:tRNA preQ1(34) S-adenosylmethionine ribosyltransferase-isomerase QueA [Candidatus Aminicenantes bacterium]